MKSEMRLLHIVLLSMFVSTATAEIFTPVNVDASDGTFTDRVRIVWDEVPNATSFRVFRCNTTGNTCGTPVGLPKTPIFNDTGGVPGRTYFYRVKACNLVDGCSRFSTANSGFRATTLEDEVGFLKQQVADLMALLEGATRMNTDGFDTLQFSGMNVQIVNGDDVTGSMNGTGNLIVGYNKKRGVVPCDFESFESDCRVGSHNVIIGDEHSFTSWGGLVVGFRNYIRGEYASVSGGTENLASGEFASISGGTENLASGDISSISGGAENHASGLASAISGGFSNAAGGTASSISGGTENRASGDVSSISGGIDNLAEGSWSSISGGADNGASGEFASISGGRNNQATGSESSISGGRSNQASGSQSSISGGFFNLASGTVSSISGGRENLASGQTSSISGGLSNDASGQRSSISGGRGKSARAEYCVVGDNGDDC